MTNNTREQWLEDRRSYLTASDVSAVLGLSKYKTPEQVWLDKKGRAQPQEDNDFLRDGRDLEPLVAARYKEETGAEITPNGYRLHVCPSLPFLAATPDFIVGDNKLVQTKTMHPRSFERFRDAPPVQYVVQCTVELMCTEREVNDLFGWAYGCGTALHPITRDESLDANLRAVLSDWWQAHIVQDLPPLSPNSDPRDVASIFSAGDGGEIVLPDEADQLIEQYVSCKEAIDDLEKQKKSVQSQLMQMMGEAKRGQANAGHITWSRGERVTVDAKVLKAKFGDIYSQVTKTAPNSSFRIWPANRGNDND